MGDTPPMADAIHGIWVRGLPPNNFFNIERSPAAAPSGGGGALYIEVPSSVVPSLLQLLGRDAGGPIPDELPIETAVIGDPAVSAPLIWRSKTGKRMRLFQNRQSGADVRHPAWRADRGFPAAPDNVASKEEAAPFIASGLRVYVVRTENDGDFAGFLVGSYPDSWPEIPELRALFAGPGGVRFFTGGLYLEPQDAANPFRTAPDTPVSAHGGIIGAAEEADATDPEAFPVSSVFPYASPAIAREVDRVAMDLALEWVAAEFPDAVIERMPQNNPGYDILVVENGEPTRYIEVKGTLRPLPRFFLSENERQFSADNSDLYTLVVFYEIDLDAETGVPVRRDGEVTQEAARLRVMQWQGRLEPGSAGP